jgi:hypothetical protein
VTVGISRPAGEIAPVILECLEQLGCSSEQIPDTERKKLEVLSPLVTDVTGALLYEVLPESLASSTPLGREWVILAVKGYGSSHVHQSRYRVAQPAMGSKRASLRLGRVVCRPADAPTDSTGQLVLPVLGDDGNAVRRLVLLHLNIAPDASLQQKTTMLRAFDDRLEDLRDRLADRPGAPSIEQLLMETGLARLLFFPNAELVSEVAPTSC